MDEPVLITTTDRPAEVERTKHVFSIDDTPYYMPAEPDGNVGLLFLDEIEEAGEAAATVWLLREMLGDDGYEALRDCRDLKKKDRERVIEIVVDHALAASEDGQGNRRARRARRRSAGRG